MNIRFKSFLLKILALSTIIVLGFNIGDNLINATSTQKTKIENGENSNKQLYKSTNHSNIGIIGVAITTNMGTRHSLRSQLPATIYKEVMSIEEVIGNNEIAQQELIGRNMQDIQEYRNVLKTDVKQLLSSSYDKREMLGAYVDQLEFRYTQGTLNLNKLIEQRNTFNTTMTRSNADIELLKQKISTDFTANNAAASLENIDEYIKLKEQFYYSRTYMIYINQFIIQYDFLNEYNKRLLDVLINNKEAIIKNAFVVIPDTSDINALRQFNLIFDEAELK